MAREDADFLDSLAESALKAVTLNKPAAAFLSNRNP